MSPRSIRFIFRDSSLLDVLIVCVTVAFFGIGYINYRPISDDLNFYLVVADHGFIDAFTAINQNKRVTAQFLSNVTYAFANDYAGLKFNISLAFLIILAGCLLSIALVFSTTLERLSSVRPSLLACLSMACVFTSGLYACTSNPQEVWFWFSGATSYMGALLGVGPFVFGILNIKTPKGLFVFSAACVLLGGFVESLVFICGVVLIILGSMALFRNHGVLAFKWFLGLVLLFLPIAFSLIDGGYIHRMENELARANPLIGELPLIGVFTNPRRVLFIALCALFLSYRMRSHLGNRPPKWPVNAIGLAASAVLVSAICALVPLVLVFGTLAPSRAFFPLDISVFVVSIILISSALSKRTSSQPTTAFHVAGFALVSVMLALTISHFGPLQAYSAAFDRRLDYITETRPDSSGYIYVSQLPDPGLIVTQEVALCNETENITSTLLCEVLGKTCTICTPAN